MLFSRKIAKWVLLTAAGLLCSAGLYLMAATCTASPGCCNVSCSATGTAVMCSESTYSATCTSYYPNGQIMSTTTVFCPVYVLCANPGPE